MKASTAIGIGVAFGSLLLSSLMGGTSPASFIDIPALMIILGGTGGVTLASVGMTSMKRVPSLYKLVFAAEPPDMRGRLDQLVSLADKARREGLLALDAMLAEIEDPFTRNALQLVVDGTDPEMVHAILEAEVDGMAARHEASAAPFEKAGGFAPTMGIIGTVLGLVHVLQNLAAPASLGPVDLGGVHRHADGRRLRERGVPADRQPPQGDLGRRDGAADDDARGNPLDPGGRQPTAGLRKADVLPAARRALLRRRRQRRAARRGKGGLIMPRGHGGRRRHGGAEEGSSERWLLTYADMITLLMALFMVLFSISSVNISKYQTLQKSLKAAFSGNILPGGKAIAQQGATNNSAQTPATVELQAIEPVATQGASSLQNSSLHGASTATATSTASSAGAAAATAKQAAAQNEAAEFAHIKQELDAYAASHGFAKSVQTTIEARGLVIKVLTDDLLFASGQATLEGRASGLLDEIAQLLNVDQTHPISVEGNTDNVPIHSAEFPSNWELSTARASTVVRFLIAHQVSPNRLTATGNAEQRPEDSNATAAGRARNRRVEIVMQRIHGTEGESESEP